MNLNGSPSVHRPQRHVIRSVLIAVPVLIAMLLGLLTIHSACTGHSMTVALPAATADVAQSIGADALVPVGVASMTAEAHSGHGLLIAMACGVLLILASLVLLPGLRRLPAVYNRLLDAGGCIVHSVSTAPLHIHRPSLTVLSISRI